MDEAQTEYEAALHIYDTIQPEFQRAVLGPPENPFPPKAAVMSNHKLTKTGANTLPSH